MGINPDGFDTHWYLQSSKHELCIVSHGLTLYQLQGWSNDIFPTFCWELVHVAGLIILSLCKMGSMNVLLTD